MYIQERSERQANGILLNDENPAISAGRAYKIDQIRKAGHDKMAQNN
jgi:hypothetical protein